jgi:5-methylcytosine-specific restriction enzyme A
MPWAAPKPCAHTGCTVLVNRAERFCPAHQRQSWRERTARRRADPVEAPLQALYNSTAWRRFRRVFLADHPLCVECGALGRVTAANVVDHVVAIRDGGAIWDEANLQPLCATHHDAKSGRELMARRAKTAKPDQTPI